MKLPAYPKYKPSGVEWLGDLPEKWEVKRLKYSASINDESLPETTEPDFEFRYVDIGGVNSVNGIVAEEELVFESAPSRARRVVRNGDTIVSTVRTYLRAIAPIKNPPKNLIVSTGFAVVRPRSVQPEFLSYAIREASFVETVVARSTGVSYPAVNATEVATILIPLPSTAEQQAIADFLDRETSRLDVLVAKKQTLIERLKEKRIALISRTVTRGLNPNVKLKSSGIAWLGNVPEHWKVVALKHLVSTPIIDRPHESPAHCDEGIPFVSAESVSKEFVDFEKIWGYISPADHARYSKRFAPKRDDILMVKLGATTGVSAIVETDIEFNIWVPLAAIRLKPEIKPRFILHVLRSDNLQRAYQNTWTYGTQQTLGLQTISNLRVPLPPDTEQIAIT